MLAPHAQLFTSSPHHLPPSPGPRSPRLVLDACVRLVHVAVQPGQHERDDARLRQRHDLQAGWMKRRSGGGRLPSCVG